MALADRLSAPPTPRHGTPCSIGALLEQLDEVERAALLEMLGTPENWGWPASAIFDALLAEGHRVSQQQINRHRGGQCRCRRAVTA